MTEVDPLFGLPLPSLAFRRVAFALLFQPVFVHEFKNAPPEWQALSKNEKAEWIAQVRKKTKEKNPDWEEKLLSGFAEINAERFDVEDGSTIFIGE